MKEINKPVFECDFCKRRMFVKHAMVKHEPMCYSNPINIPKCSDCIHLKEIKTTYVNRYDNDAEAKGFMCMAKNIELYPLKVVKMGLTGRYPETFYEKELMPNQCDLYQDYIPF